MAGSLQIKKGNYYAVVRVPVGGKMRQKWIPLNIEAIPGNKRRANTKLKEIVDEIEAQKIDYSSSYLFVDWLWKWLEQKQPEIRPVTYDGYLVFMETHIEPYFKPLGLGLRDVTPQHIQEYFTSKIKSKKNPNGLSGNSLIKHNVVIRGALQDAMWKNLIPYNPADRVKMPKKEKFVGKAYDVEQAKVLVSKLNEEPLKSAVILGLYYGLRRSEVCGLRWRDVDFKNCTMTICNTVVQVKEIYEQEQTKSEASRRTMVLLPETIPYLKALKKHQTEMRLKLGSDYNVNDHVCVWDDGRQMRPDYITRKFRQFLIKEELPLIRFHELRHTAGSILLNNGMSAKQIQEYLGHEKIATTLDLYGHLTAESKKETADKMNSLLSFSMVSGA